ncbi:hypothetical protein BSL78_10133 [Apostichopus japonicus]|uniref:Uncharacterized protein n=1 Tax=Stichopus japonicus TaxID=307972 RepID=A0A2G8KYA2_STIJA|nr:hypothetical protein BSL78_10133 [Apostichopus japonicus]
MILISTGHRSGVVLNLTAGEFTRVERFCLQDGSVRWTIKISDHKTLKSHGPTHITIDQTTYNLMLVYFNVVRPHLLRGRVATEAEERDTPFFLSNNGNRVRRLKALMVAVGLSLGVENFSPLNLRKTAATLTVQSETAAGRSRVAQAMSHTEYTQGRYYNERLAGEQACIAGSIVAGLLNGEVQGAVRKNSDLNKSGALEGLINAKISEVDGLNIPEGAMVFQPQLIPALVNVTRRYGTERSTDLIEDTVWAKNSYQKER